MRLLLLLISGLSVASLSQAAEREAIFAGGCFWCVESDFEAVEGVKEAISGYTGGTTDNPTYQSVSKNNTGHYEAVKVIYDDTVVGYDELLRVFWQNIDPLDDKGQFCDKGSSYKASIFYTPEQKERALASKEAAQSLLDKPIVTDIQPVAPFYEAESYHQNYYKTNSVRYKIYRYRCGRDARLDKVWNGQTIRFDN